MLKHATICRTKRAQQALQGQWDESSSQALKQPAAPAPAPPPPPVSNDSFHSLFDGIGNNLLEASPRRTEETQDRLSSQIVGNWLASVKTPAGHNSNNNNNCNSATSCSSSPTPSLRSNSISRLGSLSSAPSSVFNSPSKTNPSGASPRCPSSESMIKIYAQSLSQEVEYMTLHVNAQTKSRQIIRTLLRKFRLRHRDPNLFFLILERWIRKDGLKCKSVMVLSDDACPLQLQQCCSSPPHNDIKFILEMRPGALVKIFCSEVAPTTKYKCLSLSRQTTTEETIELMLNCLGSGRRAPASSPTSHHRQASSPDSTDSSSSASSVTSSSSGIESDLTTNTVPGPALCNEAHCLVIEREGAPSHRRTLEPEEPVVDVYQNMLDELTASQEPSSPQSTTTTTTATSGLVVKLIRFVSQPRPSRPLPPIPLTRNQLADANKPRQTVAVSTSRSFSTLPVAVRLPVDVLDCSPAHQSAPPPPPPPHPPPPPRSPPEVAFRPKPAERTTLLFHGNRRRYDPARLAEDLSLLDLPEHDETCATTTPPETTTATTTTKTTTAPTTKPDTEAFSTSGDSGE